MSLAELTFDCSCAAVEGIRYGTTRIVADNVDVADLISQIKAGSALDEALEEVGETDVITWLEEQGYTVMSNDEAA
ncbi:MULTISPECIES: hypothetical protein [unclassified Cedecea]|uniref:hypothetical protein n=1 Tax=unclassified Cedecea TaxID=2649846 RepID=UPI003017D4E5